MIHVIRHGQTDLNKEGKLQGILGLPLNENGVGEADGLKKAEVRMAGAFFHADPLRGFRHRRLSSHPLRSVTANSKSTRGA